MWCKALNPRRIPRSFTTPPQRHGLQTPRLASSGRKLQSTGVRMQRTTTLSREHGDFGRQCACRPFSSAGDKNRNNSTPSPSLSSSSERGSNWFINLGWALLALVVVDQALQFKQEREDAAKRQMLLEMQVEADAADVNQTTWNVHQPTLFKCKMVHVEPSLDGTKMLTRRPKRRPSARPQQQSLRAGDIVEVLEANVGPNRAYHLCRLPSKSEDEEPFVGWYPIMFLEQVEDS